VQPNDTIYSIANKLGVPVNKLIMDNDIVKPNDLVPGQALVIAYPTQSYTVQEGDTLKSIATTYNVDPMQLLRNNPFLSSGKLIPGVELTISYKTSGKSTTHGFAYPYINKETLKKTLPNLTYITIYNYRTISKGEIISYSDDSESIQLAKDYGTIPLIMLTTLSAQGEPDVETAYSIILNDGYQETFIAAALNIMKTKGYLGANIIFNYMNPSNQDLYAKFITKLSSRFKNEGFLLFVTINPNIKYTSNAVIFEKIDYTGIGDVVNDISFLQFIWGTNYGPPLPVNSIDTLKTFIDYVITTIPSEKITVGNSLVSYDWKLPYIPGKSYANSLSVNSSLSLAHDMNAVIEFDNVSQSPFFTYLVDNIEQKDEHIVWSIDARSVLALVELITEYKLKGVSFWNVMIYLSQVWLVINTHYEVEKLLPNTLFQ
jgi:spore germination protein